MSRRQSFCADVALVDIEGTISPTAFVRATLFPYASERIGAFVGANASNREVAGILEETRRLAATDDVVAALEDWQARDVKAPPLKALQGLIWEEGYSTGALVSPIFPDALEALRRWRAQGVRLSVYSSGSKKAQDLYFRHNEAGDLRDIFSDLFDTGVGPKTAPESYAAIVREIGNTPDAIVFFSDNPAELLAAEVAGLQVAHVVKEAGEAGPRWPAVDDFSTVDVAPARSP